VKTPVNLSLAQSEIRRINVSHTGRLPRAKLSQQSAQGLFVQHLAKTTVFVVSSLLMVNER
jgi:hypothetical protein